MRKDESRPIDNDHPLRLSWGFDEREGVQGSGAKQKPPACAGGLF
jgi:hypothetical protein